MDPLTAVQRRDLHKASSAASDPRHTHTAVAATVQNTDSAGPNSRLHSSRWGGSPKALQIVKIQIDS
jgi:hypothetical protein